MPRYIDADSLKELCNIMADKCDGIGESIWNQFQTVIECSPTADVVEVVRCEYCKHNSLKRVSGNAFCDLGIGLSQIYDFCSKGKRKDNGIQN